MFRQTNKVLPRASNFQPMRQMSGMKPPVRVAVTGGAGAIGYALNFRIASGQLLGPDQPVILQFLELPAGLEAMKGVAMEIEDCAFPLVKGIKYSSDATEAFEGADYALLVGARPRSKGMERGDLLQANAEIFKIQGTALNNHASKDCKTLVVGNPANTNAMIASHYAPNIKPENFMAMMMLDHTRGLAQLSNKLGCAVEDIEKFVVWGNHSATQFPDISNATVGGKNVSDMVSQEWVTGDFIPTVQQRGAAIIAARGASSAASAAGAAIKNMYEWVNGSNGQWTSFGIYSDGTKYGIEKGIWYSLPCIAKGNGAYEVVEGLERDSFCSERMKATEKELVGERNAVL